MDDFSLYKGWPRMLLNVSYECSINIPITHNFVAFYFLIQHFRLYYVDFLLNVSSSNFSDVPQLVCYPPVNIYCTVKILLTLKCYSFHVIYNN